MTHRALPYLIQKRRILYMTAGFVLAITLLLLTASVWSSNNSSVRGMVYHDTNHNGMRDPGERGVPNVYVRVAVYSEAWSHEFYTGDDGTYAPVAMSPGDYYVRLLVPKCYRPTSPTEHGVWLMEHQVILGLNFGIAPIPHCNPDAPMPMPMPKPKPMPPMQGQKPDQGGMGGGMAGHDGGMPGMSGKTHTVQAGETLDGIAEMYRVSIASLMELNNLANPNEIYVGQVLQIPGPGMMGSDQTAAPAPKPETEMASAPAPKPTHGQIYIVQPGDYLGKIAKEHGTTVQALADLNMLVNLDLLFVGQELLLP